jgi:hypothetical protein
VALFLMDFMIVKLKKITGEVIKSDEEKVLSLPIKNGCHCSSNGHRFMFYPYNKFICLSSSLFQTEVEI